MIANAFAIWGNMTLSIQDRIRLRSSRPWHSWGAAARYQKMAGELRVLIGRCFRLCLTIRQSAAIFFSPVVYLDFKSLGLKSCPIAPPSLKYQMLAFWFRFSQLNNKSPDLFFAHFFFFFSFIVAHNKSFSYWQLHSNGQCKADQIKLD